MRPAAIELHGLEDPIERLPHVGLVERRPCDGRKHPLGTGTPDLQPRRGWAVVRIRAASVNPSDVKNVEGQMEGTVLPRVPGRDFSYFLHQRGMFSYTGLSPRQVDRLRDEFAVYVLRSGRMCVAGLNRGNVEATAHLKRAMALVKTLPPHAPRTAELRNRIMMSGWWWWSA